MTRSSSSASAVVGADGTATVTFGALDPYTSLELISLSVTLDTGDGEARVYLGKTPSDELLLDGTYSGARDTTYFDRITLHPGESICVKWTNADPAANARAVLHFDSVVNRG